jgi:DNA polymerase III delta subunit
VKLFEFETYFKNGVRKFCFLFENSYTKEIFYDYLKKQGYTLRYIAEPDSYKSLAFKTSLFEKICYISSYNSPLWKWLEGKQPLDLFLMVASDSKTKTAELFQGPTEQEYLKTFRTTLENKSIKFTDAGWNALIQRFRNKDKVIEDPQGLFNAAYSIGLQVENPDTNTINQFFGFKIQFWDLFNALLIKDKRKALLATHTLLAESEPIGMVNGMQRMLCDLMSAKQALNSKKTPETYAYEHKLAPFRAQMLFTQAKTLSDTRELELLVTLNNLDMKLKSNSYFQLEEIFRTVILSYLES